jgi:ubiquinone biosynthesis monooxygenase Coq7
VRQYHFPDHLIRQLDGALKTLTPSAAKSARPSPANCLAGAELTPSERKHAAGLMRINHTGEVCAQGLYQGQALTARLEQTRSSMQQAAQEEGDHLAWCQERLQQLNAKQSLLNPLFYSLSFGLGAFAGAINDRLSLGFVAATEEQVCRHLESHLQQLPQQDLQSQAIVKQMLIDEAQHAHQALAGGGVRFPKPIKKVMTLISKAMTKSTYHI